MRPGRFSENTFENVYSNIKNFYEIRKEMGSVFPTTKIQMVLTEDTRQEIESFHKLFNEYVDDVTVIHYHERGGNMSKISPEIKSKIDKYTKENNLPSVFTSWLLQIIKYIFLQKKTSSNISEIMVII